MAGNFDPDKVGTMVLAAFQKFKGRGTHPEFNSTPAASEGERIVKTVVPEHHLSLVWAIAAWGSEETAIMQLLAKSLDERLKSAKPTAVTNAGSSDIFERFEYAGRFGVSASFKSLRHKDLVENFLRDSIRSIARSGVTENELSQARQSIIMETAEMRKTLGFIESRTELLGEGLLFRNDPDFFVKRISAQQRLRSGDIKQAATRLVKRTPGKMLVISTQNCDVPTFCN